MDNIIQGLAVDKSDVAALYFLKRIGLLIKLIIAT